MKPRNLATTIVVLGSLAGCATEPISFQDARSIPGDEQIQYVLETLNTAPVHIVRDQGLFGSGCAARVLVNDVPAAYVRAGQKVTLHIPAGEVILGADVNTGGLCQSTGLAEIEAKLEPGKPRIYRIALTPDGAVRIFRTVDR